MHPERAVSGNTVEPEFGYVEGFFDLLRVHESPIFLLAMKVGRLRADGSGHLGVIEKLQKRLWPVLGTLDAGMETRLRWRCFGGRLCLWWCLIDLFLFHRTLSFCIFMCQSIYMAGNGIAYL